MNCKETEQVIHGYLDGELDLPGGLAVEQHLQDCPVCARAHQEWRTLRSALAGSSLYFDAPRGLERRVRSAVRQASKADAGVQRHQRRWHWTWPGALAPVGAAALVLLVALPWAARHSAQETVASEILSAHIRSLMADTSHLTDVASSDEHTVKPWFSGKLPFSPRVSDLSAQGFPLAGGRLDYVAQQPVAALVYRRRKHLINLFIWPAAPGSSPEFQTRQGYNLRYWTQEGMTCWAVSDVNPADLREFERLMRSDSPSQ